MQNEEYLKQLEEEAAANLSSYEGQDLLLNSDYSGYGDPFVQFDGPGKSFMNEKNEGNNFPMKFTNTDANAVDRTIAICPGYFTTASNIKDSQGNAVDAIATDGTIVGSLGALNRLVGSATKKTIQEFLDFIKYNPTRIVGLKMTVDDEIQFSENIYFKQNSPLRNLEDRTIVPDDWKTSQDNDAKRAEIPLAGQNVQFDNQTTIVTKILAARTVTYNWFLGAILNTAAALSNKAIVAKNNIARGTARPGAFKRPAPGR